MKTCNTCNIYKTSDDFYFRKDSGKYQNKCKSCTLIKAAKYRNENRETIRKRDKKYYYKDIERSRERNHKKREAQDVNKRRAYYRRYMTKRRRDDVDFRLSTVLRQRISKAVKYNYKTGSAVKDIGCSMAYLRTHLESQFYPHTETGESMTWDNYGRNGWHIDHIIPLSKFDLSDASQFKTACNYINLQPLWSIDNIRKSNN